MAAAMTPRTTVKQIKELTSTLVGLSLSDDQNFPSTLGCMKGPFEITVKNATSLSVALRNLAYRDIYAELEQARCFNFKMLDGALVTLRYRFNKGKLCEHALSYFPSPDLEHFQSDPEIYLLDAVYADVVARNIVPFPIRFDFNDDPEKFVEGDHPYAHLTLGQYENCRIPVCAPLTPLVFGGFVLRNFYNTAFRKYSNGIPTRRLAFPRTITPHEQRIPHIAFDP